MAGTSIAPHGEAAAPNASVVTVSGQRPVSTLGVFDAHDHLFLDSPALAGQAIDDVDRVTEEVREARDSGISCIVEMTPIGLGRDPAAMRRVAEATGVAIIAATGYHRDAHYPDGHWVHTATVELLAERVVADVSVGMHPTDWLDASRAPDPARAGAIKGGASYHRITRGERRRLEAIAGAAVSTGAAVLVHTEVGTAGHDIVDLLEAAGLDPTRIALAHLDRNPDPEIHAELAARGVTLEYDTIGRTKYHPDSVVLDLIEAVSAAGHVGRIVLGLDLGMRSYYRAYDGGPGLRYLMTTFVPRLRRRMGDEATDRMLISNPARLYAIRNDGGASGR